ncbi:unnamed protein product [Colias eurytheme]|nr:unnamed protein product [Colias eurytheme]
MNSNNTIMSIPKLTGRDNWSNWSFAVRAYLQHEELDECLTREPDCNDPKAMKKDVKAKSKLILLIDPILYIHIQDAVNAKQVWDNLTISFEDQGLTRKVGLLKELINTDLESSLSVEDYVNKIMTAAHKLRNIKFHVDDEWLGTLMLAGLPDMYKPMIMGLESSGMKISADLVKNKLLQEVKMSDTTALYTNTKKYLPKSDKKGPRCFNCNKYGHLSKNCWHKKTTSKKTDKDTGYVAAFSASTANESNSWHIDSGASMHMTMHRDWLTDITVSPVPSIRIANNKELKVECCGNVCIKVKAHDGSTDSIQVRNVLFVPELKTNLLSVSKIIQSGCNVIFNESGCKIYNASNKLVAHARLMNATYLLNTLQEMQVMMAKADDDTYLWHQRMGHLNFTSLNKVPLCTEGVNLSTGMENSICVTCLEGKQTRKPFPAEGSRATSLLELIHSDVCGPMQQTSIGGASERMNRTLIERAKCMLLNSGLQKDFWAEAVTTAAYIVNRSPTRSLSDATPYEVWTGKKPNLSHMRIFGCPAMVHIPKEKRSKLDVKSRKLIFVGYSDGTKGYKFIDSETKKGIVSKDVVFLENSIKQNNVVVPISSSENIESTCNVKPTNVNSELNENSLDNSQSKDITSATDSDDSFHSNDDDISLYIPERKIELLPNINITTRSKRLIKDNNTYLCIDGVTLPDVPQTYSEAVSCRDGDKWKQSIQEELKAHKQNETWTLVEKPPNVKTIGCKWVFRIKDEPTGHVNGIKVYLLLYVDDGLIISKDKSVIDKVISQLKENFEVKTMEPRNFVGLQIERSKGHLFIHQTKYIEKLLIKFNMNNANGCSIPIDPHTSLIKKKVTLEERIPYREAVGSLMHLAIVSRPDIMFGVSLVSRYLDCYDDTHWVVVKKILKYLKETKEYGINYSSTDNNIVEGYSDSDYATDTDSRRSTSGYVFIKNGAAVTWSSQRQQSIALSTTEAEFMAACSATKEALWIKRLLCDISAYNQDSICLNVDNQSAISVIKNVDFHKRCKHIDVKYKFVKEKFQENEIDLSYICTNEQCADIFTKPLPRVRFQYLRDKMGVKLKM